MDTELNVYDRPVERYDDGSRELTKAERIEQIGWEIERERAERQANICDAKADEINQRAGLYANPAACYRWAEGNALRIANLQAELKNLTGASNAPRNDEE